MNVWLLIILLVIVCGDADSSRTVYGRYGSDLHLPLVQLCEEPIIDVHTGETHIGNYHDHVLQGFRKYKERLQYDRKTCTFIIKSFSKEDAHNFTFTNFKRTVSEDFKVLIPAVTVTSEEYISNECTSGLLALGFSLDPIICLGFIILADRLMNGGKIVSCIHEGAIISFLGKDYRRWMNSACMSIKCVSLLCQAISLISLACCEGIHGTDCIFMTATLFTVIHWFLA
ncbi:unnamed protein product, partial [Staurois parvus]